MAYSVVVWVKQRGSSLQSVIGRDDEITPFSSIHVEVSPFHTTEFSNEKNTVSCLVYIRDYTTQLYGDYIMNP